MNLPRIRNKHFFGALLILALLVSPVVAGSNGRGLNRGNVYYDPDTVTTLTGELILQHTDWVPYGNGNHTGDGLHFQMKASDGTTYELILGNYLYLAEAGLSLAVGDTVKVTGSIVDPYNSAFSEFDYLIAAEITADGVTVQLRDSDGYPLWRGSKYSRGGDGRPGDGVPNGAHYFDPATVATFSGEITEELGFWGSFGNGNFTGSGMHYLFEAKSGEVFYAMFGPYWFLDQDGIDLEEGIKLTVKGSVVDPYFDGYDDHDYLIVSEITVDGKTVQLRDDNGYPLWRGTGLHYASPAFDSTSTSEITGTLTNVRFRSNGRFLDVGLQLRVRAQDGSRYRVFVAPQYYTNQLGLSVAKGDTVRIRGSLQNRDMTCISLGLDGQTFRLRDRRGNPRWVTGSN